MRPMTNGATTTRDHVADAARQERAAMDAVRQHWREIGALGVVFGAATQHVLERSAERGNEAFSEAIDELRQEVDHLRGVVASTYGIANHNATRRQELLVILAEAVADMDRRRLKVTPDWQLAAEAAIRLNDEEPF